jgi:hypothetical protein
MSRGRSSIKLLQQLAARGQHAAAAASHQQQQQQLGGVALAARLMSSAASQPNSKDGKVLHPDLLNANLKKTQVCVCVCVRCAAIG